MSGPLQRSSTSFEGGTFLHRGITENDNLQTSQMLSRMRLTISSSIFFALLHLLPPAQSENVGWRAYFNEERWLSSFPSCPLSAHHLILQLSSHIAHCINFQL